MKTTDYKRDDVVIFKDGKRYRYGYKTRGGCPDERVQAVRRRDRARLAEGRRGRILVGSDYLIMTLIKLIF